MRDARLSEQFLKQLRAVEGKRPKVVVDHILANGHVTTEELREKYGYGHPPRAARDLREQGIPLVTFRVKGADGRSIAAYKFGDPATVRRDRLGGRRTFSKAFRRKLFLDSGHKCSICLQEYEERYLQVDHRVPYEVSGDAGTDVQDMRDFMLLCGCCNRAKSWSCQHCPNWIGERSRAICSCCYWGSPESYKHIALREERRLDLAWRDEEVRVYERLKAEAKAMHLDLPLHVKAVLKEHAELDR